MQNEHLGVAHKTGGGNRRFGPWFPLSRATHVGIPDFCFE